MVDIKELNDRINNCKWKRDCGICSLEPYPCQKIVEKGDCEVVINFFREKNKEEKR